MSSIKVTQKGSFDNITNQLHNLLDNPIGRILERYGEEGVRALSEATPVDSGETAQSWYYEIVERSGYVSIRWHNSHSNGGSPIAILLQYGHGTGTGGWVEGRDYINLAIQPIFDKILVDVAKEVVK